MTFVEFLGCTFLTFGAPFGMFLLTVLREPIRILVLLIGVFIWLLSLMSAAAFWFAIEPLQKYPAFGVILAVLFQEGFRIILYRFIQSGLIKRSDGQAISSSRKHILSYASGFGYGLISGAFSSLNMLSDALGPGTRGLNSQMTFMTSSAMTLCFILLHTFWNVIFFSGLDHKNKAQIGYVIITHLLASCITLLNYYQLYLTVLIFLYCIMIFSGIYAFKTTGGSWVSVKSIPLCF